MSSLRGKVLKQKRVHQRSCEVLPPALLVVGKEVASYASEAILEELRFKLTSEKVLKYIESRVYALWIYRIF